MTGPLTAEDAHLLGRHLARCGWPPGVVDAAVTGDPDTVTAATTDTAELAWHLDLWATARLLAGRPCPAVIDLADRIRTTAEQERTP